MITQDLLKEYFKYYPETGKFIRLKKRFLDNNGLSVIGDEAGTIQTIKNLKYRVLNLKGKGYRVHRLIWLYVTGKFPETIDHEDGNGLNNKWSNLRDVSMLAQARNHKKQHNNTSGTCGVNKSYGRDGVSFKWLVRIGIGKSKRLRLGLFDSLDEAIRVRKQAEVTYKYHKNHGR